MNIDHVATIRNARGGRHPDPVRAAMLAIAAGADGITAHLREDRRHIRDDDIARLKAEIDKPLNFEMAATAEMVAIALKTKPHAACLVPEKRTERTTEGGLDAAGQRAQLEPVVHELKHAGIRVSLFIGAQPAQIEAAAALGAPVVELHTGAWCDALAEEPRAAGDAEWELLRAGARWRKSLGLEVHAGHGLDYASAETIAALPQIVELNIGHFLVGEAMFEGLAETVKFMRAAMDRGRRGCRVMIIGIGSDIVDVRRIESVIERHGERFIARIFTATERAKADGRANRVRNLRQAVCGQGGLRQGARAPASAPACSGATSAWSICRRAGRPCGSPAAP